jgi:hypothetical protein
MTVIGLFCRPNHPKGYAAWPPGADGDAIRKQAEVKPLDVIREFGAHGYVTWFVTCKDWVELNAVRDILRQGSQWDLREDTWYAGPLDFVLAFEGHVGEFIDFNGSRFSGSKWISIGDNRAIAVVGAETVLAMKPTRNAGFWCHAGKDGECHWMLCPQLRDGEPAKTRRHCPLDSGGE